MAVQVVGAVVRHGDHRRERARHVHGWPHAGAPRRAGRVLRLAAPRQPRRAPPQRPRGRARRAGPALAAAAAAARGVPRGSGRAPVAAALEAQRPSGAAPCKLCAPAGELGVRGEAIAATAARPQSLCSNSGSECAPGAPVRWGSGSAAYASSSCASSRRSSAASAALLRCSARRRCRSAPSAAAPRP